MKLKIHSLSRINFGKYFMSKKTVFTFSSVLLVCTVFFMACQKSSSNPVSTPPPSGGTTAANSIAIDGTPHTVTTGTSTAGNYFLIVSNTSGSYPSISLTFTNTTAPAADTYTACNNLPTSGMCQTILTPTISVTWTVVTCHMNVTSGSSRSVSFSGATFTDGTNTHTVSANLPF